MSAAPKIAAGYCRVSSEEQRREGFSLEEQERRLREAGAASVFIDAGISGRSTEKREGLRQLLAEVEAGRVGELLIPSLDRLGRNARDLLTILGQLEEAGVVVRSLRGDVDTSSATGRMLTTVVSAMAELESDLIGERTSAGLQAVARTGRQPCGQPPLGYRAVGRGRERKWIVADAEAEIARRIFSDYLAGAGTNSIAARLNADGVRTRRGAKFSARVVLDVLDNPTYIGRVRLKGEEFKGNHDPIIDLATWERTRVLREARRKEPNERGRRPGPGGLPRGSHVLIHGLLRCGLCGSAMSPRTNGKDGWQHYRCSRGSTYGDCAMPAVARRRIDEEMLRMFEVQLIDVDATLDGLRMEGQRRVEEAAALAEDAEQQALTVLDQYERVERDYLAGELSAENWQRLSEKLGEQRAGALAEAERHRARAEELGREVGMLDADAELRARMAELKAAVAGEVASAEGIAALRAALTAMFEEIVLVSDGEALGLLPYLRPEATQMLWDEGSAEPYPRRLPLDLQPLRNEPDPVSPHSVSQLLRSGLFGPIRVA